MTLSVLPSPDPLTPALLGWFAAKGRDLPWRVPGGPVFDQRLRRDPYRVWLSEIMLQQTTVAAVIPYFHGFLDHWPDVRALARADRDHVLRAWAGLGYYARARNLHACARVVTDELDGRFPETRAGLMALPGVGPYTAGAIAAIVFGESVTAVDGNVIRVLTRLRGVSELMPRGKGQIETLALALLPPDRPGDFAEALMDLGATVCTPRAPKCEVCPWAAACFARAEGQPEAYPRRAPKKEKPIRRGIAFWVVRDDGAVLLRRRADKGLLGGMMEVPSTDWAGHFPAQKTLDRDAPVSARWQALPGMVRHTFTHFHLELKVVTGQADRGALTNGVWCVPERLSDHALPTVMKKVARHALGRGT